jgi:hypothetical protein
MSFLAMVLAKFTGEALKGGAEIVKTVTEIPKNVVETEKACLEVAVLKMEEKMRGCVIVAATFEEVREFVPLVGLIRSRIEAGQRGGRSSPDRVDAYKAWDLRFLAQSGQYLITLLEGGLAGLPVML